MAAGNTIREARAQALSEIFERAIKYRIIAEGLCLPAVPDDVIDRYPAIAAGIAALRAAGFGVLVKDASLGGKYPVMNVTLINPQDQGVYASFGAHPRLAIALERALTELLQGRPLDALAGFPAPAFDLADITAVDNLERHFVDSSGVLGWDFLSDTSDYPFVDWNFSTTTDGDYQWLVDAIHAEGKEIYVADFEEQGAYSCRILVPGFSEIYPIDDLEWENNSLGNALRPQLVRLHDLSVQECTTLLAELQTSNLNDERPVWEILGLAVAPGTPWKQLRIGELKTLLALVVGDEEAVLEGCYWIQHYGDLPRPRLLVYRCIDSIIRLEEPDNYRQALALLYGAQTVALAEALLEGAERFFGLDNLGPNYEASPLHQGLLAAYDKLFVAEAATTPHPPATPAAMPGSATPAARSARRRCRRGCRADGIPRTWARRTGRPPGCPPLRNGRARASSAAPARRTAAPGCRCTAWIPRPMLAPAPSDVTPGPPGDGGHKGRRGNGKDPGPDDVARHAPAHGRHLLRRAHADDGAGDGVRGRDRHAQRGGQEQRDGAAGLGAEAAHRFELGDLLAHGLDDAPAAEHGAERNGRVARNDHPQRRLGATGRRHAGRDQEHPDDADGFLGVVAAVAEAHHDGTENKAQQRRQHDEQHDLDQASRNQGAGAALGHGRTDQAADQRVRGRRRNAVVPGKDIPHDGAHQRAEDDVLVHHRRIDGALAHRGSHRELVEHENGHEVEERGHGDGRLRLEHAGGHHRGNRIGGVMEAVHEVEHQREGDQNAQHPDADMYDGLHLDQVAHVRFVAEQLGHGRAHHVVGVRLQAVDLFADGNDLARVVHVMQQRYGLLDLLGAGQHQFGQALGFRRDRVQVVQRNGLGRVFQQVEDVVLARDQLVDVVAVDRGDKSLVQQVHGLVRDLVGLLFDAFDRVHAVFQVVEVGHQAQHFFCTFDAQPRGTGRRKEASFRYLSGLIALIQRQITDVVAKLGVLADPGQTYRADRAVTLLTDNDFGRSFIRRVGVVHLVAVQEDDDVRILLDRARFAQVGHDGTFVGALLQRAVQLRQRDHRAAQLLGQALERAGNLGDLGSPVVAGLGALHQLQVVDNDQAELAALARQAARAGAHLDRVQGRGFVDEQLGVVHLLDRVGQARPVLVVEAAGTQAVLVELANRAQHTHGQLGAAHLHREDRYRQAGFDRHVFADIDRECGFTHRRTAGHDDQVAALQPRRHAVEIDKARGHARDLGLVVARVQLVDALDHLRQQRLHGNPAGRAAGALLGNGKDLRLRLVEHLLDFLALRAEGLARDLVGHGDQLAQDRAVAHDLGIAADVGSRWRVLRHGVQVRQAAHVVGLAQLREVLEDGNDVGRLGAVDHLDDLLEDDAVVVTVKVFRVHHVGDTVERGVIAQQAANDGLFCFDGMRRDAERIDLRIGGGVHGANYTCLGLLLMQCNKKSARKKPGKPGFFSWYSLLDRPKPDQVLGSFAYNSNGHFCDHVGVQSNAYWELASGLQGTGWQAHGRFLDSETDFAQRFSDVEVGDGAEQTAVDTRFLRNGHGHAVQFLALGLGSSELGSSSFFQFSALDFEFRYGSSGSAACHFLRDQEVTCVTVFNFNDFTQIGVWQQGQITGAFDRGVHLALVVRLGAGQTCWHDLAVFLDEVFQGVYVFVVHLFYAGGGEAAELLALEQWVLLLTLFFKLELVFVELFTECHVRLLYLN
uniref:YcaO domain-containing protein n=1 Tax=Tanacetum cinerariifolium TaxID=118510 RepID=A0A699GEW0_TANCI|nr:hypothetical protein [Tanacetum cinerariifolium]